MIGKPESREVSNELDRLVQLARAAVRRAQAESRQRGVPNVYSLHGRLYSEGANGELIPVCGSDREDA